MEEMIKRKNALLEQGYDSLNQIEEIAILCTDVFFTNVNSAQSFIRLVADALGRLTADKYDMLQEANNLIPEPEQVGQVLEDEN